MRSLRGHYFEGKTNPKRFLGRLYDRGAKVHQIAGDLLSNPESKPNPPHSYLTTIASGAGALRLVTTNFDNHFSAAAKAVIGNDLQTFMAPALPLGGSFEGIVYLHVTCPQSLVHM